MYKIKSCPRCRHGDVYGDKDQYGAYEQCFQCGWTNYPGNKLTQEQAQSEQKQPVGVGPKEHKRRR